MTDDRAYSRGSKRLAGAASLKHRVPAMIGAFRHVDIAQWVEQQTHHLRVAGSNPAIPTLAV